MLSAHNNLKSIIFQNLYKVFQLRSVLFQTLATVYFHPQNMLNVIKISEFSRNKIEKRIVTLLFKSSFLLTYYTQVLKTTKHFFCACFNVFINELGFEFSKTIWYLLRTMMAFVSFLNNNLTNLYHLKKYDENPHLQKKKTSRPAWNVASRRRVILTYLRCAQWLLKVGCLISEFQIVVSNIWVSGITCQYCGKN